MENISKFLQIPLLIICAWLYSFLYWSSSFVIAKDYPAAYSFSGEMVHDKTIRLDDIPLKSHTHYLTGGLNIQSYSFMVKLSSDFDGVFITLGEFKLIRGGLRSGKGVRTPICTKYNIEVTYPDETTRTFCDGHPNVDQHSKSKHISADFKNYEPILVNISFIEVYPNYDWHSPPVSSSSSPMTVVGPNQREIPMSTMGALTFTSFTDCSNITSTRNPRMNLRSCSDLNQLKCIESELFCDGGNNCVPSMWEILMNARKGRSFGKTYDESEDRCHGRRNIWMDKNSFSKSYSPHSPYGYEHEHEVEKGGWHHVFWIFVLSVICFCVVIVIKCVRVLRGQNESTGSICSTCSGRTHRSSESGTI